MPKLSAEQWRQLRGLAGLPDGTDAGVVFAAVKQRLARRVDPRRRDAVVLAAVSSHRIPISRAEFWSRMYEHNPQEVERTLGGLTPVAPVESAATYAGDDLAALEQSLYGETEQQRHAREDAAADRVDGELRRVEAAAGGLTDDEYRLLFGPG